MTIYLSENIRRLRLEKELTQETLSEFLGVTSQSISNWERGESYPDITMLPEIAGFFRVSVDDLLGVNRAEDEAYIVSKLKEYDNLTDHTLMQEIVSELKDKYPNDFRVLIRQLACLVRFTNDKQSVFSEVHKIYNNIRQNCTDDRIRIKSQRAIIEYYHDLADSKCNNITIDDCKKIIAQLPDMRDSREMFCFYHEENTPEFVNEIRKTMEEQFLLLNTVFSHYFHYNVFFYDRNFSDEWVISALKAELDFLNFVYDDGNYGKMWRTAIYNYGHLGVMYFKIGDTANALQNFQKMCEYAIKFDNMDRTTIMHSVMFEGKEFDKHTLGSTYIAKTQAKELLTKKYPLSEEFKNSVEFKEMLLSLK